MTECYNTCDEDWYSCWAEWYDIDGNSRESTCEDYHQERECDGVFIEDECFFEECSDDGNCWEEVCNEGVDSPCVQYRCQMWEYREEVDHWEEVDCPERSSKPGYHFERFRRIYNQTFKDIFNHTCPHGHCFEDWTQDTFEIFAEQDEAIDGFLADDEFKAEAASTVDDAESFLEENGFEVSLDFVNDLLESEDTEALTEQMDNMFAQWSQSWVHGDTLMAKRKGARGH